MAQAAEYWKGVSLSDRRSDIDAKALAMYGDEERSVAARKKLAENTKNLKRASDPEKIELIGTVLKSYQEEINQLTRRSKFAENAFLTLYKALYEAPDPYPLLAQAANDATVRVQLEFELHESRQKLMEYDTEFANLKNQEYTIRKLENENKQYERRMEQAVTELASSNRSELEAETQELRRQMAEQERVLKERIAQAKNELTKALSTHAETQSLLLDATSKAESVEAVTSKETEMLAAELERANLTIASLKQQITTLKAENSRRAPIDSSSSLNPSEWEEEMTSLRTQLENSEEKYRDLTATFQEKEASLRSDLARAHAATNTARAEITRLTHQLSELPSRAEYQSLRKQVALMQEMEFNVLDAEGEHISRTPAEQMLLQKTRRLESEVTHLKLDLADRIKNFDTLQQTLTVTTNQLHQQQALVTKLEADLAHVHVKHKTPRASSSSTTTLPGITPIHIRIHSLDKETNDDFEDDDDDSSSPTKPSIPDDGNASMLQIVIGQRDRFREHMEALEKDKSSLQQQIDHLTTDVSRLKQDNLKLYEKLQYVRSYTQRGSIGHGGNMHDIEMGRSAVADTTNTEKKYESLYEEKMNPFGEFKKQQRAARYENLSLAEKATLRVGKFLFSKKVGRNFLFFYALTLHLLVMVVLWTHTFYDHCKGGNHKHL